MLVKGFFFIIKEFGYFDKNDKEEMLGVGVLRNNLFLFVGFIKIVIMLFFRGL